MIESEIDIDRVRKVLEEFLRERFSDIEFDCVDVEPDLDEYGEEVLFVTVVLEDGDWKKLSVDRTIGLAPYVRERLSSKAGTAAFPVMSYTTKSEWEEPLNESE